MVTNLSSERICRGDHVLSADPATGKQSYQKVTRTFVKRATDLVLQRRFIGTARRAGTARLAAGRAAARAIVWRPHGAPVCGAASPAMLLGSSACAAAIRRRCGAL